jgi:hypothetical protein
MEYKIKYEVRQVSTIPCIPADAQTQAYMSVFLRLEMDALSIHTLSGGTIEQARETARALLTDKERMILAQEAERVEYAQLPAPQEPS